MIGTLIHSSCSFKEPVIKFGFHVEYILKICKFTKVMIFLFENIVIDGKIINSSRILRFLY